MAINRTKGHSAQAGFSLVETVLYTVGVAMLVGVIVTIISYTYGWYRYSTVSPRIDQVGSLVVDRIEDDIRAGQTLNTAQDTFGTSVGSIGLNALDATKASVTYYYALQGGRVIYQKNGGTTQYISPVSIYISKLRFDEIDTAVSTAIHFTVSIDYLYNGATTTSSYNGLAIMRNSYN